MLNDKYLMHYNKNHDILGRFAKSDISQAKTVKKKISKKQMLKLIFDGRNYVQQQNLQNQLFNQQVRDQNQIFNQQVNQQNIQRMMNSTMMNSYIMSTM